MEELVLNSDFYTPAAIEQTIRDFAPFCSVTWRPEATPAVLRVSPLVSDPQVIPEFLNYVLGLSAAELLS